MKEKTCTWTQDEDGNWETQCGNLFVFTTEGPIANGAKFCLYCGGPLIEKPWEGDD